MRNWLKKFRSIPNFVAKDIFLICRTPPSTYDLERMRRYINEYGIDKIDTIWLDGLNPLMTALEYDASESKPTAQLLVDFGSNLKAKSSLGFSVLLAACKRRDCFEIICNALRAGCNPNEKMGNDEIGYSNTALGLAVATNNEYAVSALLQFGATVGEFSGDMLIFWALGATQKNHIESDISDRRKRILEELMVAGVNFNASARISYWVTPLQFCLSNSMLEISAALCDFGADPNYINFSEQNKYSSRANGITSLEFCKEFRAITFLQDRGVDIRATVEKHFTPAKLLRLISQCGGPYNGQLDCILDLKFSELRFSKEKLDADFRIKSSNFSDVEKVEIFLKQIIEKRELEDYSGLFSLVAHLVEFEGDTL